MLPTLAPNHHFLHLSFLIAEGVILLCNRNFLLESKLILELINNKFGEAFLGEKKKNHMVAMATVGQTGTARWDSGAVGEPGAAPYPENGLPKPHLGNEGEVQVVCS